MQLKLIHGHTESEQPEASAKRARSEASLTDTEMYLITSRIAAAYSADPTFTDDKRNMQWKYYDDLWWDHDQILVPDDKEVKQLILHQFHDDVSYAGHLGIRRTDSVTLHCWSPGHLQNRQRYFTWPNNAIHGPNNAIHGLMG